jgi:hypothetical protein
MASCAGLGKPLVPTARHSDAADRPGRSGVNQIQVGRKHNASSNGPAGRGATRSPFSAHRSRGERGYLRADRSARTCRLQTTGRRGCRERLSWEASAGSAIVMS